MFTLFRYRLAGSPTYSPQTWLHGSYESRLPLSLAYVLRRLARDWRKLGVSVLAVELEGYSIPKGRI